MIKALDISILKSKDWKETIYRSHAALMLGVAVRYTKNRDDAEDVLHDSFINIFENISRFKDEGSLEGWMRRIVVVNAIKKFNSRILNKELSEKEQDNIADDLEDDIEPTFTKEELLSALQELPIGYRTVFNLYAVDGYSHKEISIILEISEGTSRSQFMRAKNALKLNLTKYQNHHETRRFI
jgi:RNA polymerase sigma factor (sigma-70 family)